MKCQADIVNVALHGTAGSWACQEEATKRIAVVPAYLQETARAAGSWEGLFIVHRLCESCPAEFEDSPWVELM